MRKGFTTMKDLLIEALCFLFVITLPLTPIFTVMALGAIK